MFVPPGTQTGVKVNSKFMNAVDPWPETKCSRQDCMVCQTEGKQGRCWRPNVTYQITCLPCQSAGIQSKYCGESGRNAYSRGLEHQTSLEKVKRGQPLADHCIEYHQGIAQKFQMEVTGGHNKPLPRLVAEGQQIDNMIEQKAKNPKKVIILNGKNNFHQAKKIKFTASKIQY